MATVRLWTDNEAENDPAVKAMFDDIRRVRGSNFISNLWRALTIGRYRCVAINHGCGGFPSVPPGDELGAGSASCKALKYSTKVASSRS